MAVGLTVEELHEELIEEGVAAPCAVDGACLNLDEPETLEGMYGVVFEVGVVLQLLEKAAIELRIRRVQLVDERLDLLPLFFTDVGVVVVLELRVRHGDITSSCLLLVKEEFLVAGEVLGVLRGRAS